MTPTPSSPPWSTSYSCSPSPSRARTCKTFAVDVWPVAQWDAEPDAGRWARESVVALQVGKVIWPALEQAGLALPGFSVSGGTAGNSEKSVRRSVWSQVVQGGGGDG